MAGAAKIKLNLFTVQVEGVKLGLGLHNMILQSWRLELDTRKLASTFLRLRSYFDFRKHIGLLCVSALLRLRARNSTGCVGCDVSN